MLIHIGYHKTATSWLQEHFFPIHPELEYWKGKNDVNKRIVQPHSLDFDADRVRASFDEFVTRARAASRKPILSAESLSGSPHNGGAFNKEIADRLHAVFPEGKIVAVIRRQPAVIASAYKQYVRGGGICRFEDYVRPPVRDQRLPLFRLENYQYHRLLEYYVKLFGRPRVGVLLFEEFCSDPETFLRKLAAFFEIQPLPSLPVTERVNEAHSDATLAVKRIINIVHGGVTFNPVTPRAPRFCEGMKNLLKVADRLGGRGRRASKIDAKAAAVAAGIYVESNRRLAALFDLDLKKHGYEL